MQSEREAFYHSEEIAKEVENTSGVLIVNEHVSEGRKNGKDVFSTI
jgi:hypothetical protein